jgi:hypothetical protein
MFLLHLAAGGTACNPVSTGVSVDWIMSQSQTTLPNAAPRFSWRTAPERAYSWLVLWSEEWGFLKILEAASKFVIVVALIQWFLESGSRAKDRHYRAWQIVNSARGAPGDGGRLDALQDLNADGVPLENAPLSEANLVGIQLQGAKLSGANLISANLSSAKLQGTHLDSAKLNNANLIGADLSEAKLGSADLTGAKLLNARLSKADLTGVTLDQATFLGADLTGATFDQANFCRTVMPDGTINNKNCNSPGQN